MKRSTTQVRDTTRSIFISLLPASVRETLLADQEFVVANGIMGIDATLSVDNGRFTFSRNEFLRCVRLAYRKTGSVVLLRDKESNIWDLKAKENGDLHATHEGRSLNLRDYELLKPNGQQRLAALQQKVKALFVDADEFRRWHATLRKSISNETYYAIVEDLDATPLAFAYGVGRKLRMHQSLTYEDLVPQKAAYYRRLTGLPFDQIVTDEYTESHIVSHINTLLASNSVTGLKLALLLSGDSVADCVDLTLLDTDIVLETFRDLVMKGDRVSQLGAIELGFRLLPQGPALEGLLESMIEQICNDTAEDPSGRFYELSALLLLVSGELSHKGFSKDVPPSWRRTVAMSHAALLQGAMIESGEGQIRAPIYNDIRERRGPWYYVASLVDLRNDTGWQPEYAYIRYLRNGFLTRIWLLGQRSSESFSSGLNELFTEGHPRCIKRFIHPPYVVGPTKGSLKVSEIPAETLETVYQDLNKEILHVSDFVQIVALATYHYLSDETVIRLVEALKRLKDPVDNDNAVVVKGLAMIAASSRNEELADQIRHLCRVNLFPNAVLSIEAIFEVVLIAAASRSELESWCIFGASWFTELAFYKLDRRSSQVLAAYLLSLIQIAPELKPYLRRALAALECVE